MKKLTTLFFGLLAFSFAALAQTADEIIANYFENTGGYENWGKLTGVKMKAKVNQQGLEIPLEIVQLADGRTYTKVSFQGQDLMQGVYDGTNFWSTNFQTMKPEKVTAEDLENFKLSINDFPDPFYNYKAKGYTVELIGKETVEGTETFKIKLVKEPMTIDGQKVEDVTYYFFDTENFVPIVQESEIHSGQMKGAIGQTIFSDFQEVEGLYFPFTMAQGIKDGPSQPLTIEAIEINPTVDEKTFAFPGNLNDR